MLIRVLIFVACFVLVQYCQETHKPDYISWLLVALAGLTTLSIFIKAFFQKE